MQAARTRAGRGYRQVHPFGIESSGERGIFEAGPPLFISGLECLLCAVDELAAIGALLRRELAHVFAELREHALASEHFKANGFEIFSAGGRVDTRQCAIYDILHQLCRGKKHSALAAQFPAEMADIEKQQRLRVLAFEALEPARLPAIRKLG